ncbi:hypothetical protein WA026_017768 [Henosepilachna vigintioctopunctata]|uniref:Uncharacterized protein n=1 Tax=Henosepilachna vigintioctopunctata TaxID=420089 RepID=A0AAW1U9K2_9CUCU
MKFARKAWYSSSWTKLSASENEVEVGSNYDEWAKPVSHDHNTTGDVSIPTFEDFVQIDDHVTTTGKYTDDDIVQNCVKKCTAGNDSEDETEQFTLRIGNKRKFRRNKMLSMHYRRFTSFSNMRRLLIKPYLIKSTNLKNKHKM